MFTSTVLTDDHKLLHNSNLTARQPRYTSHFKKRCRLANEGLGNLTGIQDTNSVHHVCDVIHYSTDPWKESRLSQAQPADLIGNGQPLV